MTGSGNPEIGTDDVTSDFKNKRRADSAYLVPPVAAGIDALVPGVGIGVAMRSSGTA